MLYSCKDPYLEVEEILGKYSRNPESEPRLKLLLPHIVSTFGSNKSVKEIMEDVEKNQKNDDPLGKIIMENLNFHHCIKFNLLYLMSSCRVGKRCSFGA